MCRFCGSATTSRTPGPIPFQGLALGCFPPNCATLSATPRKIAALEAVRKKKEEEAKWMKRPKPNTQNQLSLPLHQPQSLRQEAPLSRPRALPQTLRRSLRRRKRFATKSEPSFCQDTSQQKAQPQAPEKQSSIG
jgi:hypothetical protein